VWNETYTSLDESLSTINTKHPRKWVPPSLFLKIQTDTINLLSTGTLSPDSLYTTPENNLGKGKKKT
jgi:hypothetical protein